MYGELEWLARSELRYQVIHQRLVLFCTQFSRQRDDCFAICCAVLALKLLRRFPQCLRALVRPYRQVAMPRRDQILTFAMESLPCDVVRVAVRAASTLDLEMKACHWYTTPSGVGTVPDDEEPA